jgi:hypothetical protein
MQADMQLTLVCKDGDSGIEGCPSIYSTGSDYVVVQGEELADPHARAQLSHVLEGETAVLIRKDVVLEAARRLGA